MRRFGPFTFALVTFFAAGTPGWGQTAPLIVGISANLTGDLSVGQNEIMKSDFSKLVKDFAGLTAELSQGDAYLDMAKKLDDGKIQLGVFQGIEFAWAREKFHDLKPLMVAEYKKTPVRALLIVKKDGPATLDDLKGKDLGWLKKGREHCQVFLEKLVKETAQTTPDKFFKSIDLPKSGEVALDDVLTGKTAACVVDEVSWKLYGDIQPGRFGRLKALKESETFPLPVIAYHPGGVSDEVLAKFKAGMTKANTSPSGQEVMTTFKISTFENVPANYDDDLARILKAYPAEEKK